MNPSRTDTPPPSVEANASSLHDRALHRGDPGLGAGSAPCYTMPMTLTVEQVWRYPVKSLQGERLDEAVVIDTGIEGDRAFGIRDLESGLVLTGRRQPELLMASAVWRAGEPMITLPDGSTANDDDALSRWIGRAVELVEAGTIVGTFENPLDVETETDWVQWNGPADTFHDSARTRMSLASLATIGDWDARRFRKNLVCSGEGEDDLVGQRISIGTAAFEVTKRVERCVMVTRPLPGAERDPSVLRTIARERSLTLGVGLIVEAGGTLAPGDVVT